MFNQYQEKLVAIISETGDLEEIRKLVIGKEDIDTEVCTFF